MSLHVKRTHGDANDAGAPDASAEPYKSTEPHAKKMRRSSEYFGEEDSSDASNDESTFQEQLTQFRTQQRAKPAIQNEAAENGIIETITCTNFMCHSHLEISLGPLINFIIGHNGSGKSAVLTALTICLGGKASATNRGQSLKSFVKEGTESAMLRVQIKNRGDTAYQPEIFGSSIIVERHFSRSGASSFKIKSYSGRLISSRKADLDDICDYFALQIDNPMNVLTQDMARQFLNSSNPQEKYKFFMKGTQLEHLDGDYLIVEENLDTIDTELGRRQQDCALLDERAAKAEELLHLSEQQDDTREKIQTLRSQSAWVQVEEQEKALTLLQERFRTGQERCTRDQMTSASLAEVFSQTEKSVEQAKRALQEAQDVLSPLQDQKSSTSRQQESLKQEQLSVQAQERDIVGELNATKSRISSLQQDISNEKDRLSVAEDGDAGARFRAIENQKEKASNASNKCARHKIGFVELEAAMKSAKNKCGAASESCMFKRHEIDEAKQRLRLIEKDGGRQANAYPSSMPRLLQAIRSDDTFLEKPVGPLGNHVRLLKPAWSSILEKAFGSTLEGFIVVCKEDQSRLSNLMTRVNCQYPILIVRKHSIDTSGHEPDDQFDTALRVLEIDNDLVRSSLIINQMIDQTILVADRREAIGRLSEAKLRNVKQCFTFNIAPGTGSRFSYGYGGGLAESFQQAWRGLPRMKTDIDSHIRAQSILISKLTAELDDLQKDQATCIADQKKVQAMLDAHEGHFKDLRQKAKEAQKEVEDLQDSAEAATIEADRIGVLHKLLEDARGDLSMHEGSYGDAIITKDRLFAEMASTRERLRLLDSEIEEKNLAKGKAQSRFDAREFERRDALREKNIALDRLAVSRDNESKIMGQIEDQQAIVNEFQLQATAFCARVVIQEHETEETINRKLAKLQKDLTRAEQRIGNRTDIAKQAEDAILAHERASAETKSSEALAQLLKTTLINRKERWNQFRKFIGARARCQFFFLLTQRGFRGSLQTNHQRRTLELTIEPDETQGSSRGRKTYGLSGGEKSFSTICLLLAIWEAMGAPVRALDEFDVFMDSVNREISMQLMIAFARDSPGKQFILISPQSMGKNMPACDVKFIKMSDPERGQQNLSFAGEGHDL